MSWIDELKSLEKFPDATEVKKPENKFPCARCGGTGVWHGGYINPVSGKCHACNGRGYFNTSARDRANAKAKRVKKKKENLDEKRAAFEKENPGLVEFLLSAASWNDFAVSMLANLNTYGSLTDNMIAAVYRMMEKAEAREKERAEKVANAPILDLSRILAMFESAKSNGLKRPKLRVGDYSIYPAPMSGKNAGYLYVKYGSEYMGKIAQDGKYIGKDEALEELKAIAADPIGKLSKHGRDTGVCSCCGRELTNKASIAMGIGPICAEKYGL